MNQTIIDEAVKIATRAALNGKPVRVRWVPPQTATEDYRGSFDVSEYPPMTASQTPPWGY